MNAVITYIALLCLTGIWTASTLVGAVYALLNVRRARRNLEALPPEDAVAIRAAKDQIAINVMISAGHMLGFLPAVAGFGLRREAVLEGYSVISLVLTACLVGLMVLFALLAWMIRHADLRLLQLVRKLGSGKP